MSFVPCDGGLLCIAIGGEGREEIYQISLNILPLNSTTLLVGVGYFLPLPTDAYLPF